MRKQQFNNKLSLWTITEGQRMGYLAAIVAMAITNLFMFGAPLIGKYAIDLVVHNDFSLAAPVLGEFVATHYENNQITVYMWLSALLAVVITAIAGIFLFLRGRLAASLSENVVRGLREALYKRLHLVSAQFYDEADTGDLVQRCSSDIETIRVFLATDIIEIGRSVMLLLCVMPILFWLNATLAWYALCLMPLLVIGAYIFFSKVKDVFQITDESEGAMTATLQENLTGIRVVRAFARQQYETDKFGAKNADFRNNNFKLIQLMALYWSSSDLIAMAQIGIVLFMGAALAQQSAISLGTLFAFITYEAMVIWPVRQLGRVLTDTGKAVVALERVNHILEESIETNEMAPTQGRAIGSISCENLSFSYPGPRVGNEAGDSNQPPTLNNLSIDIAAGETIGIVGPPGCGKSTFIRILMRLYAYTSGSIKIDGQEISGVNRQWLRAQVGVVLQDPFLYSRSVGNNLLVGRPQAVDSDVLDACEDAAILSAIENFPDGFEAMVGERGVTLSGGQRQRLALARALLKDPPILVLDDSLSAVDTGTEEKILTALRRRKGRQTTLIIAHRLSSVLHADRIMVMDAGSIVQLGTHEALKATPGPYQQLCQIQGALDASIADDIASGETHG